MRKLFSTGVSDNAFSFAMLVMRVGIGSLILMQHGLDKLMHFSARAAHFSDPFRYWFYDVAGNGTVCRSVLRHVYYFGIIYTLVLYSLNH